MTKRPDDPKKERWDQGVLRKLFPCFFWAGDTSAVITNPSARDGDEDQDDKTKHTSKPSTHTSHDTRKKSTSSTHAHHLHPESCSSHDHHHKPRKHRHYVSLCPVFMLAVLLTILQALAILYSVFFI